MEAYELSKLMKSIDSILLKDFSTIKTISSTEMWLPIYVCNFYKFVPILFQNLRNTFSTKTRTCTKGIATDLRPIPVLVANRNSVNYF